MDFLLAPTSTLLLAHLILAAGGRLGPSSAMSLGFHRSRNEAMACSLAEASLRFMRRRTALSLATVRRSRSC